MSCLKLLDVHFVIYSLIPFHFLLKYGEFGNKLVLCRFTINYIMKLAYKNQRQTFNNERNYTIRVELQPRALFHKLQSIASLISIGSTIEIGHKIPGGLLKSI